MTKLKVSQEAFEEMVTENMETFDMEAEEALSSAVEELKLQGADLSGIIQIAPGTKLEEHAVAVATNGLKAMLEKPEIEVVPACEFLDALKDSIASSPDDRQRDIAVAVGKKFGAIPTMVQLVETFSEGKGLTEFFSTMETWLTVLSNRQVFFDAGGVETVMKVLEKCPSADFHVVTNLANLAAAASLRFEGNKCRFVDLEFPFKLHDWILKDSVPDSTVVAASHAFISFCTPDDPIPPATHAFQHARLLSSHDIGKTLMRIIAKKFPDGSSDQQWGQSGESIAEMLKAVKCLAANDDICKNLLEDGGVEACLRIWRGCEGVGFAVATVSGLLRQMSQSDAVKQAIMSSGGAEILPRCLTIHVKDGSVLEPVLGLMTNIVLRQPNHSVAFCDAGVISGLSDVLSTHEKDAKVLRQACMCVRNMVSRAFDLRPVFLENDFEEMFRGVKSRHPKSCGDAASAVLRDLGLDDYH
ncbi:hypothetical protein BSKO_05179 [Bryopsis sp. KO-2023]|nr:hypothetical protein BSKO_05179 [Bryopsis sp. KO-2023]